MVSWGKTEKAGRRREGRLQMGNQERQWDAGEEMENFRCE